MQILPDDRLPVFDREAFDTATLGDPALQRVLLSAFLEDLPALRALISAPSRGRRTRLDAGMLRSRCVLVGARRLAALLEASAAAGQTRPPAALLHGPLADLAAALEAELWDLALATARTAVARHREARQPEEALA